MENLVNGIHAWAMDLYIKNQVEMIDDEDKAQSLYDEWLSYGVPDGSTLGDNMEYYGSEKEIEELRKEFLYICNEYEISTDYSKELNEIILKITKKIIDLL